MNNKKSHSQNGAYLTVIWRQHVLPPLKQERKNRSSVFFPPTPRHTLSHSHQVRAQWGEPHTVYAFSLTPLDSLGTLFRTYTEWLADPYALPLPGPNNGTSYVKNLRKKLESTRDVRARENALGKSGKTDPFHRATEFIRGKVSTRNWNSTR